MEDPRQYLNDQEEAQRLAMEGNRAGLWTAMPGIVQSVDAVKMTCSVQLTIQGRYEDQIGDLKWVNIAPLQDVPIVFPSAGGFLITLPIAAGDEVLVVFASRCIDAWWQSGGYANKPLEFRMHDLSDGFCIPGPKSEPAAALVAGGFNTTDLEIRNIAGDTYLSLTAAGKVGFANVTTDLKTVLTDFQSAVDTFMTALAAFGGGGAPVTQTMLQAPAAAAHTSLAAVLVKIGALLK